MPFFSLDSAYYEIVITLNDSLHFSTFADRQAIIVSVVMRGKGKRGLVQKLWKIYTIQVRSRYYSY